MSSSEGEITAALKQAVDFVWHNLAPEELTVTKIRDRVERERNLAEGFFLTDEWKLSSKQIIKDAVDKCDAQASEPPSSFPSPKIDKKQRAKGKKDLSVPAKAVNKNKREAAALDAPKIKRPMKKKPSSDEKALSNNEEDGAATKATKARSSMSKDASEGLKNSKGSGESLVMKRKPITRIVSDDEDDELQSDEEEKAEVTAEEKEKTTITTEEVKENAPVTEEVKAHDSDSELSSLLSEDPAPKKKPRSSNKPAAVGKKTKKPASATSSSKAQKHPLSADEALIKTLQTQLGKCGIRKIWAIELKRVDSSDDIPNHRARIQHLRALLRDAGMTGRFSEQRAREIKEMRELQADLQDVIRGDESWGVHASPTRSRPRLKPAAKSFSGPSLSVSDEHQDDDDDDDEVGSAAKGETEPPAVKKNMREALAFLGDESESD